MNETMFRGLKVGDEVVLLDHGPSRRSKVSSVGRLYFTVDGRPRLKLRLADGTGTHGYSYPRAISVAEAEERARLDLAIKVLARYGLRVDRPHGDAARRKLIEIANVVECQVEP